MKVKNVIKIVYILSAPPPLLHIVHDRIGNAMNELMHKKSIKISHFSTIIWFS